MPRKKVKNKESLPPEDTAELALVKERMEDVLKATLKDVQGYANKRCLAVQDPDKWMKIAGLLLQGKTPKQIEYHYKLTDFKGAKNVEAQLMENPAVGDVKREFAVKLIDSMNTGIEIVHKLNQAINHKLENTDMDELLEEHSLMDLNRMATDRTGKEFLGLVHTINKLTNIAPPAQEVVHRIPAYEGMMEEIRKAREKENALRAVPVEVVEGELDLNAD